MKVALVDDFDHPLDMGMPIHEGMKKT